MSKRAEQRGLEAVPPRCRKTKDGKGKVDSGLPVRKFYIRAYEQAEKDTLDRVSDWLRENIQGYLFMSNGEPHISINGVIEIMRCTINEEE